MSSNIGTNTVQLAKSPLEDFLHRTNDAGLNIAESSANGGGNWEIVNEDDILDEQDNAEWVLVGRTDAKKHKQVEERKTKECMKKRAKRISQP
ncbi:uncharacterized protein ALTATR162_LOCUS9404 [Alternaria atra]|jgi:hypothetical protein|uniref:Uncharacterized protein n=1 Tax=Alternaria atra TaxID=119953 RepID=A0A8J2IEA6_9PLEO|nr:uncharacterized protein ALTATR162_LOCUS9404 [Alternaria atra]CAG5180777.1 unnamed protein product [Alternaria atra]